MQKKYFTRLKLFSYTVENFSKKIFSETMVESSCFMIVNALSSTFFHTTIIKWYEKYNLFNTNKIIKAFTDEYVKQRNIFY